MLDSRSWVEAYVVDDKVAVELHEPARAPSVGWVDKPRAAGGELRDLLHVVRRATAGKDGVDAAELTARLAGAISRKLG